METGGLKAVSPGEIKWMLQSGQEELGENVLSPLPGNESTSHRRPLQFHSHSRTKGNAVRQPTSSTGMSGRWDRQPIRWHSKVCGYAIWKLIQRH